MAGMARHTIINLLCISLSTITGPAQVRNIPREIHGRIIDRTGAGVANATLVASGAGFNGWVSSGPDGSFHLKAAGLFISVRHPGMKARLIRTSELSEPVQIQLEEAGVSARKMPRCSVAAGPGEKLVGGGLKVNAGRNRFRGPINGEHDSHWYLTFGKDTLHIVDGYAWHAGLPLEERLAGSQNTSIRSWEFEDLVGLDLSGKSKEGKSWRWIGAPISDAIEYTDVTPESAAYFDKIIESTCFESMGPTQK
jgi:hypothetical protein